MLLHAGVDGRQRVRGGRVGTPQADAPGTLLQVRPTYPYSHPLPLLLRLTLLTPLLLLYPTRPLTLPVSDAHTHPTLTLPGL